MVTEGINGPINYLQEEMQVEKLGRPTTLKPQSTTFMENLIKKKNKLFYVGLQIKCILPSILTILQEFSTKKDLQRDEKFLSIIMN